MIWGGVGDKENKTLIVVHMLDKAPTYASTSLPYEEPINPVLIGEKLRFGSSAMTGEVASSHRYRVTHPRVQTCCVGDARNSRSRPAYSPPSYP